MPSVCGIGIGRVFGGFPRAEKFIWDSLKEKVNALQARDDNYSRKWEVCSSFLSSRNFVGTCFNL